MTPRNSKHPDTEHMVQDTPSNGKLQLRVGLDSAPGAAQQALQNPHILHVGIVL